MENFCRPGSALSSGAFEAWNPSFYSVCSSSSWLSDTSSIGSFYATAPASLFATATCFASSPAFAYDNYHYDRCDGAVDGCWRCQCAAMRHVYEMHDATLSAEVGSSGCFVDPYYSSAPK